MFVANIIFFFLIHPISWSPGELPVVEIFILNCWHLNPPQTRMALCLRFQSNFNYFFSITLNKNSSTRVMWAMRVDDPDLILSWFNVALTVGSWQILFIKLSPLIPISLSLFFFRSWMSDKFCQECQIVIIWSCDFFFCDYGVLHWFILKHWTNPSLRYRIPFTFCPVIFANILSRDVFCISTHKEHLSMNFSPCLYSFVSICHNCNASLINCRAVPYTDVDHVDS